MKNIWKWILLGAAVFLLAFCIALPLFNGFSAMPMRWGAGSGLIRGGMVHGAMIGGIGMLFRLILPVIGIAGLAALIYVLVKRPAAPPPSQALPTKPCDNCGKPLDPGWVACPFCGKKQK
jgi:zinc-ribbon domain